MGSDCIKKVTKTNYIKKIIYIYIYIYIYVLYILYIYIWTSLVVQW